MGAFTSMTSKWRWTMPREEEVTVEVDLESLDEELEDLRAMLAEALEFIESIRRGLRGEDDAEDG